MYLMKFQPPDDKNIHQMIKKNEQRNLLEAIKQTDSDHNS